jgi:hypothetical protein
MVMRTAAWAAVFTLLAASTISGHAALSYVDLYVRANALEVTVVGQASDFAHELGIDPPDKLMDLEFLAQQNDALVKLVEGDVVISADGVPVTDAAWDRPAAAPEQKVVTLRLTYPVSHVGRFTVRSRLFGFDSAHQTLVNVYEGDTITTQQMLDADRVQMDYFPTSRAGFVSVAKRFAGAGTQAALAGYNHVLFVAALFLLGGPSRRVAAIAAAFSVSCLAAFAVGVFRSLPVMSLVVTPGIALSVVYASVDNIMVRDGRDMRVWIAVAFGWVHGFGFANAISMLDRPFQRFAWAAISFGSGAEAGVLLIAAAALALAALASAQGHQATRLLTVAGSLVAAIAGVASFMRYML